MGWLWMRLGQYYGVPEVAGLGNQQMAINVTKKSWHALNYIAVQSSNSNKRPCESDLMPFFGRV